MSPPRSGDRPSSPARSLREDSPGHNAPKSGSASAELPALGVQHQPDCPRNPTRVTCQGKAHRRVTETKGALPRPLWSGWQHPEQLSCPLIWAGVTATFRDQEAGAASRRKLKLRPLADPRMGLSPELKISNGHRAKGRAGFKHHEGKTTMESPLTGSHMARVPSRALAFSGQLLSVTWPGTGLTPPARPHLHALPSVTLTPRACAPTIQPRPQWLPSWVRPGRSRLEKTPRNT